MHYGKHARRRAVPKAKPSVLIEPLEDRRLLSHGGFGEGFGGHGGHGGFGRGLNSVEFSQAPAAVQTGLDNLASTDKLTAPTATQTVFLGNRNGIETYTVDITGTGTQTALTVDQNGSPVTAPTNGTTTYGAVPPAVSTEAAAIAGALGLTVPAMTANVPVSTPTGGTSVYTIALVSSATSTSHLRGRLVRIDASGNPLGNLNLPFVAVPTSIQTALNNNRPSGATALATTSTQNVKVHTNSGVTTYSTSFTVGSTTTTVTVNAAGALTKLPSHTTTTFSTLSSKVQTAIQALATGNGATGTIAGTTTVQAYDEANGTTIYSVNVNGSKIGLSGSSFTYNLTISVDQNGNPTTLPGDGERGSFGGSFGGFGGNAFFGGFGFFGRRHR